ncbi:carboxylase domain protein [Cooperia oncophora]
MLSCRPRNISVYNLCSFIIFQSSSLNLLEKFPLVCKNYAEANKALGDIIKASIQIPYLNTVIIGRKHSSSLNLLEKFPLVCKNYAEANKALGDIIKVAPSSKVVGDLALFMTQHGISSSEELEKNAEKYPLPKSVQDFFEGKLGQPTYGFPKTLQEKVLRGKKPITGRPGASLKSIDLHHEKRCLEHKHQQHFSDRVAMSSILFPEEFDRMIKFRDKYGPVELLPTDVFFAGPEHHQELEIEVDYGKVLYLRLTSVGEMDDTGRRQVHFDYNGQERSIFVNDREYAESKRERAKAEDGNLMHHGAPMKGKIVKIKVQMGEKVSQNQDLFVLSAMKMEIAKTSNVCSLSS